MDSFDVIEQIDFILCHSKGTDKDKLSKIDNLVSEYLSNLQEEKDEK